MLNMQGIRAIAFDADDTLWELQNHFEAVEHEYCRLLAPWGCSDEVSAALFATETANMADMGYGCKAFTISLVENAVRVSHGAVTGDIIGRIVELGKSLLHLDATPLEGVEETLRYLHDQTDAHGARRYRHGVGANLQRRGYVAQIGAYAVHVPFRTNWAHEKTEEYEHERLWRVDSLKEMLSFEF